MKRAIATPKAPAAVGPYSQAVEDGAFIFCSGQIALEPGSTKLVEGGIEAQTRRVLANLREVLAACGLTLEHVVKSTIFLVDLSDYALVNRIYGEHFEPPFPARSTVAVAALPLGAQIEIEVIARRP